MLRRLSIATAVVSFVMSTATANAASTNCGTVAACIMGTDTAAGYRVEGASKSGTGVFGITTFNATSASAAKRGVQGYDQSTSSKGYNVGVYGLSTYGTGLRGVVGTTAAISESVAGVAGYSPYNTQAESAIGVLGDSYDYVGVEAVTESSEFPPSIALQAVGGDEYVTLFEGVSRGFAVAKIDGDGNMILAGTLQQSGSSYFRTSGANGSSVTTFGDRISQPTLEDLGEAQLVNGKADVMLDGRFGASVDARAKYLVFLTPMGDTRGLYVSERTGRSFTVREVGGGHSTLAFDYRIAAKPYDTAALRLPSTNMLPQLRRNVVTAMRPGRRRL